VKIATIAKPETATRSMTKTMNKIVVIIISFLTFNEIKAQDFQKIAENIMVKDSIPEMTFAIVTKDSFLIKKVLGHHKITELNEKSNANINDYFHLGSNTKAITGFIAGYLVDKSKIEWDTKFFDLFPELKKKSNKDYHNITLQDLLTHRANIQPFTSGTEFQKLPNLKGNKQQKRQKFARYVLTLSAVHNNTNFNYSNAGYSIATIMLEKVSGKSWESLCKEILKSNLNIDFVFGWPNRNEQNQPYGHWIEKGKIVSVNPNAEYDLSLAEPAGDLSMNIENYTKFIQLNIKGLSQENDFLKSNTYNFLHTAKDEYAIGWGNYTKNNKQISEHAGSDGTFFCYAQIDREKLIGYVVIVNSGTENAQSGVFEMINELKKK
jgi:CubicO group peptidase (beta-lactamase class C family)